MSTRDNNGTQIGQLVLAEYSSAPVVAHFAAAAKAGLWPSERELIHSYFQPGRVLDLGCGAGRVTIPLSTMGFEVIGVDISPAMVTAARELTAIEGLFVQYEVGDAVDLQFDRNTFDHVVFSNQGWMQIPGASDRLRVLREIRRVLVDGGLFLFSTHSRPCVLTDFLWVKRWLLWHGLPLLGQNRRGIDFGDLFYVRRDVEQSLEQFLHIPTRAYIQKLLQAEGFQLLGTLREQTIKHHPFVYVARKDSK